MERITLNELRELALDLDLDFLRHEVRFFVGDSDKQINAIRGVTGAPTGSWTPGWNCIALYEWLCNGAKFTLMDRDGRIPVTYAGGHKSWVKVSNLRVEFGKQVVEAKA